jgi:hypothetical protein
MLDGLSDHARPPFNNGEVAVAMAHQDAELDAFRPLVERGLLDFQEDWKHYYVKLTDAAWKALAA